MYVEILFAQSLKHQKHYEWALLYEHDYKKKTKTTLHLKIHVHDSREVLVKEDDYFWLANHNILPMW
jgi:hypothetical protein